MRAVLTIARLTLQEAVRARLTVVVAASGTALVGAGFWLRELSFGVPELRLLLDCGYGAISLGGTVLAVAGTTHLCFSDWESRRVHLILSRPVARADYLTGKLAGVLALLAVYGALLLLVLAGVLAWWAGPEWRQLPWAAVVQGGALLWIKLAVLAALALFVGCLSGTALFANTASLALVLAGHMKAVLGPPGTDTAEGLVAAVLLVLPDFRRLEPAVLVDSWGASPAEAAAYGVALVVLYAMAGCIAFRCREL